MRLVRQGRRHGALAPSGPKASGTERTYWIAGDICSDLRGRTIVFRCGKLSTLNRQTQVKGAQKMSTLPRIFSACAAAGIGLAGFCAPVVGLQKQPLSQVKCECRCVKHHEDNSGNVITEILGSKSLAAPGGDPKACTGLDGTTCRSGTLEGKLDKCSGVVERKRPTIDRVPSATETKPSQ
jgi:hypothetical protein